MPSPNWSELRDAYGAADEVGELLEELTPDPDADVWGELWGRICHQGTVYSATFAALPVIAEAAARWKAQDRLAPLTLASGIVSSRDGKPSGEASAHVWRPLLPSLRLLLEECIRSYPWDPYDAFYLLGAWLSFREHPELAHAVEHLADEEIYFGCPSCGKGLFIAIGDKGNFASAEDYVSKPHTFRSPITPASPKQLAELPAQLHQRSQTLANPRVSASLLHAFGDVACPSCKWPFNIWSALSAHETNPNR